MTKIRFGIVGTGNIAHRFAEAIKNVDEAELAAVASRDITTAEIFGRKFGIKNRFGSYESMAQSDVIDAAYIAVPHSLHKACSCLMMENNKHVICEKPIAVNYTEASEMFECAKKNSVFLMEAMWARLVPGTIRLLRMIDDGVLGKIIGAEGKFCYTMDEDELDHHVLKKEYGGGSLLDVGCYGLNFVSWYLGKNISEISAVCDTYNGVDSHTCIIIKNNSGAIADVSSGILIRKPNEGYIYGTDGYIRLSRFYAPELLEFHMNSGENFNVEVPYEGNGFEEQIRHVCKCISAGLLISPVVSVDQTLYIMKQMDEIRKKLNISYPQD